MSHIGTRLLADRCADAVEGLNAMVQRLVPVLDRGDLLPIDPVTIYDDTRDLLVCQSATLTEPAHDPVIVHDDARHIVVCRLLTPPPGGQYPCVRFLTLGIVYETGSADVQSTTAVTRAGTLSVAAQIILQKPRDAQEVAAGMYLLRALTGVIARFDASSDAERVRCGVQLSPSRNTLLRYVDASLGDTLVSPGALMLTYPFIETLPLPLSLR